MNNKLIIFLAFLSLLCLALFSGCKKEKYADAVDNYTTVEETLTPSSININSASLDFIEFEWTPVTSSTFNAVKYDLYLDGKLIVKDITTNIYTFINLPEGTEHQIKVVAKSQSGRKMEISISGKTLASEGINTDTFYKEFQLFENTSLTGPSPLYKLKDEGHLIIRLLQHPNRYDFDTFKFVMFRMDRNGNILWYRLLSTYDYSVNLDGFSLAVDENVKQGVVMSGQVFWKVNIETGQNITIKELKNELDEDDVITSTRFTNSNSLLVGTFKGKLLEFDFLTFSLRWKQDNPTRKGSIKSILLDSKGYIYYIYSDESNTLLVHKATHNGVFLKEFKFDGSLSGDSDHFGFGTNFMVIDNEDNIYLFGKNYYSNSLRYFKITTEGQMILKTEQRSDFQVTSGFFDKEGNLILYGYTQGVGIDFTAWIHMFDKSMKLLKSISYPKLEMHFISGVTQNSDASFNLFLHYVTTYTYENRNFVYIRTRNDGTF